MVCRITLVVAAFALLAGISDARAEVYRVTLSGANENPPVASPGVGTAIVTINNTTHELRVVSTFSGLVAGTSASHIHCCAVPPANAGVATTTPSFVGFPLGVTSGSFDRTYLMTQSGTWNPAFVTANGTIAGAEATFVAGVAAGRSYLNIHSTTFPSGEIRGTLVQQTFAGNAALSPRAQGVAAGLDSLGAGTGVVSDAIVALAIFTPTQQADALERLAPTASNGVLVAASESVSQTFDQVGARLDGLRMTDESNANSFWLKGYGVWNSQDAQDGYAGYKGDGWGGAAGFDHRFDPNFYVGAALSYADASLSYRNQLRGNSDDIKTTQLSVYGTQDMDSFYIDAAFAYAWQDYESTRDTGVGLASAAYDGNQWGARIGVGVPLALSGFTLTPQARLDWYNIDVDGYTESGAGPLALAVASRSADGFRSSLGARADFGGEILRPFVRAYWNHDFSDSGLNTSATFLGGGAAFVTPGQELEQNSYSVGAGVNFFGAGAFSGALVYDGTFSDSYQSHLVQAKARFAF